MGKSDILFNSIWIIGFILYPVALDLQTSSNPQVCLLGLFIVNLLFGKIFWDSLLPSFGEQKSIGKVFWMIIWGPIANLISGLLIIKILTWILDFIFNLIISKSIINYLNYGLNAISDFWIIPVTTNTQYEFSIGLVVLISFILQMRILPLKLSKWKKIILFFGVFALIIRTLRYVGGDFQTILGINKNSISENYSFISILIVISGWLISLIIELIRKPVENKV